MTVHDFRLAEVVFPNGYSIDGRGEKLLRIDSSPDYESCKNMDFGELLSHIEYELGSDIFALFPIKLDLFGESRFQLVLRDKDVMAVADNGDLVEPERLEAYNEELAKRSKRRARRRRRLDKSPLGAIPAGDFFIRCRQCH